MPSNGKYPKQNKNEQNEDNKMRGISDWLMF